MNQHDFISMILVSCLHYQECKQRSADRQIVQSGGRYTMIKLIMWNSTKTFFEGIGKSIFIKFQTQK